jgi:hypothetical protein
VPWFFVASAAPALEDRVRFLEEQLGRLSQLVQCYERVGILTYGPNVRVPGELDRILYLRVTNGAAFTIENPERPREGVVLHFHIFNDSGGAMGPVTWGSEYTLVSPFVAPGPGDSVVVTYFRSL